MNQVNSVDPVPYVVNKNTRADQEGSVYQFASDEAVIEAAFKILKSRMINRDLFQSPDDIRQFLVMNNAKYEDQHRERFTVMFLDCQSKLLGCEEMFVGTLASTSVHPREVVRAALRLNAAAIICSHNHPSGATHASSADQMLTKTLKSALALVDVRLLDHFIVTPDGQCSSMAEMGLV